MDGELGEENPQSEYIVGKKVYFQLKKENYHSSFMSSHKITNNNLYYQIPVNLIRVTPCIYFEL